MSNTNWFRNAESMEDIIRRNCLRRARVDNVYASLQENGLTLDEYISEVLDPLNACLNTTKDDVRCSTPHILNTLTYYNEYSSERHVFDITNRVYRNELDALIATQSGFHMNSRDLRLNVLEEFSMPLMAQRMPKATCVEDIEDEEIDVDGQDAEVEDNIDQNVSKQPTQRQEAAQK
ncbi:hypothetical protein BS47DRAFT_1452244 [Hydnum rufescens UP504]|uniref:Uncharacterized protein n=1 Tax=Hydnum rufescens UP504 TaxID=1448309 RepID=A0A9P6AYW1_9AGAM|nr:hypothetical protein BS47DRAFT_1452244 [Hydnum rufescens UP504]